LNFCENLKEIAFNEDIYTNKEFTGFKNYKWNISIFEKIG
jgi:hypothetical protein